jgi:hypothetical protein
MDAILRQSYLAVPNAEFPESHPLNAQEEDGRRRGENPVVPRRHAGSGRECACFLRDVLGVAAHASASEENRKQDEPEGLRETSLRFAAERLQDRRRLRCVRGCGQLFIIGFGSSMHRRFS